jgi:hypothetical protein
MSNRRKLREARGGGFTRPKRLWHGHSRGHQPQGFGFVEQASELNRGLFNAALTSLIRAKTTSPNRSGDR